MRCAGVAIGGLGGLTGTVMVPEDGDFMLAQPLRPRSFMAKPSGNLQRAKLHVDDFEVRLPHSMHIAEKAR